MPVEFDAEALRYRGGSRERCFQIFNELGFRTLAKEYAPTAGTIAKTYRVVNTAEGVQELAATAAGRGTLRAARPARPADGDARVDRRPGVFDRAARRRLRAGRASGARRHLEHAARRRARRRCGPVLEDEAIGKDGHDLKFDAIVLARHGVTLRGLDTDTMLASYLLDATRSEHLLEDLALEHTSYKALTEEDVCGRGAKALSLADLPVEAALDYAGERADLVGQLAPLLRELLAKEAAERRSTATLELPLVPVLVAVERAGIRDRRPGAGGAVAAGRAGAGAAHGADLRDRRRRVQHQLAEAARGDPVRQAAAAGAEAHRHVARAVDRGRGARGARAGARSAAADPRVARADEAEGHLHRRAAAARAPRDRPRAHLLQPGGRRDRPAEQQRSEPAEHPDQTAARPRDPRRVHRRPGQRPDLGRLLADRVPRARAPRPRIRCSSTRSGEGRRLPRADGAEDLRRRQRRATRTSCAASRRWSTTRCSTGRRAFTLSKDIGVTPAGGAGVHRRLLRRLPARPRVHRPHARGSARHRRREDDVRPAAAGAGAEQPQLPDPRAPPSAMAVNMPIQGIGRRHHEARDDRGPRRARRRTPTRG